MRPTPRLLKESAGEYALRYLRDGIINLTLPPGAMISAQDLAATLGISRTPAREALRAMEKTGILEIYPQAGSRISYIDYEKIHESRFIRLALEAAVAESACAAPAPPDWHDFEEILQRQENSLARGDAKKLLELDNAFHRLLYELAGKMMTHRLMADALCHFDRVRVLSLTALTDIQIVTDHRAIFEAVKKRDKRLARRLVTSHLSRYLTDEKAIRKKYPWYFSDWPRREDHENNARKFKGK